ncbi:molecular chaperone [Coemansia sp. RSA 552]|nr:molecular chaperone [Coemansia sp. RSA 552]
MTQAEVKKRLDRLESTARFLDSCWVMPCTCNRVRFGMDSLVGFVPVIGDFAGVIMALLYVGAICGVFSTPAHIKAQMFLNVAIDFCVGLVPVLGDIVDILFKANMRNHTLISRYVEERRSSGLPLEMGGLPVDPARPKVSAPASAYIPKVPFKPGAGRRVADLAETSQTSLLCENQQCAAIQPVGKDVTYYDVLVGGPPTFDIDTAQLRRNFLRLQQAAHPDSFSQREDIERKLAEAQSAWINHAYSTLLDPLQRAHYLLRLGGREIGEEDQVTDPELLMEVMESRTDIEDAKTEEQVGELGRRNNEKMAQTVESLAQAFRENRLDDAHRQTSRLQYLRRVAQAIRDWEP